MICVGLALMTLVVFAQTITFEFLNFDDDLFVSANPRLASGLDRTGIAWAFSANLTHHDPNAEYWEPLTLLSRLADVQFSGLNAGAHHRTTSCCTWQPGWFSSALCVHCCGLTHAPA